jgi:hypothetical protein
MASFGGWQEDAMNTRSWKSRAMAVVVAGATAIAGAVPASAAPVLTNTAAVKQALPGDVQNVRWGWRGGWGGGAFFGGLVAGGLIGAAFARPYYYGYPGYYGYGYGYGYSPYAYGYSYPYYSDGYAYPYSYGYGYPSGGYYGGGYYGGWRGYGLRGYGWRGAHVRHYARHR